MIIFYFIILFWKISKTVDSYYTQIKLRGVGQIIHFLKIQQLTILDSIHRIFRILLRRMPVSSKSASCIRVRIASGGVGWFPFLWRSVDWSWSSSQKVLRPFGFSFFNRNAFRRGHPFDVILHTYTRHGMKPENKPKQKLK